MSEPYEPEGIRFRDSSGEMLYVTEGGSKGWVCYRHPDGQWVTLREISPLVQPLRDLERDLETARATNRRLHRRCQQAEGAKLEEEIQKFRERLRSSLGHSNCYCQSCKDLTARFWWPEDAESGPPGIEAGPACMVCGAPGIPTRFGCPNHPDP